MWAQADDCGLVANNVGPVADNVVSDCCLFANNLGRKRHCLWAKAIIIAGPYTYEPELESLRGFLRFEEQVSTYEP